MQACMETRQRLRLDCQIVFQTPSAQPLALLEDEDAQSADRAVRLASHFRGRLTPGHTSFKDPDIARRGHGAGGSAPPRASCKIPARAPGGGARAFRGLRRWSERTCAPP